MKKIISLFQRNYQTDNLVRDEVVPGAEWVIAGEGLPTRKYDGTCCMIKDGVFYKRYDAKAFTVDKATGERHEYAKKPPLGFMPAQEPDPQTGHWPGWILVGTGPEDQWHREALRNTTIDNGGKLLDGTYELVGPKIQGNPESYPIHELVRHGESVIAYCPIDFDGLKSFLQPLKIEGIVWHHPDGRMVKIKRKDFFRS